MGSFTTTYSETILDQLVGTDAPFLALFTASPGDSGAVTDEVSASGYDRQDISADWEAAGGTNPREVNTNAEISFAKATETWGTISHLALCAAVTEGVQDLKIWGALTNPKNIESGDQLIFSAGNITISVAAG